MLLSFLPHDSRALPGAWRLQPTLGTPSRMFMSSYFVWGYKLLLKLSPDVPPKVDLARSPVPASSYFWLHLLWVFPLKKRHCSGVGLHILRASGSQVLTTQSHLGIFTSIGQTPNLFKIIIINLSFAFRHMQIYANLPFSLCFCILSSL